MKLGYFQFKGRGHVSRLLLAYTQTQHKEIVYSFKDIGQWLNNDKQKLNLTFPQLPYLIQESSSGQSFQLTQSSSIEQYIILKSKKSSQLLGRNIKQKALIDNTTYVIRDIFNALIKLFLSNNFSDFRKPTYEKIKPKLQSLERFIGQTKKFTVQNHPTYPDFSLLVAFDYLKFFFPYQHKQWINISRVVENVQNLPQILKYYNGEKCIKNLMFPHKQSQQLYRNLQPLQSQHKEKQIQSEQLTQQFDSQLKQQINQQKQQIERKTSNQIGQKPSSKSQKQSTEIIKTAQNVVKEPIKTKQTAHLHKLGGEKTIASRMQQYMKAAEVANNKGSEPSKIQPVVPSKPLVDKNKWLQQQNSKKSLEQQSKQKKIPPTNQPGKVTLGYWGVRALGQVQRHLLSYCNVDYQQKIYKTQQQWFTKDKPNVGLLFPNLPYLIDKQLKLTESLSIDRYIINQYGNKQLLGKNLRDGIYVENIAKTLNDIFKQLRVLCFTDNLNGSQLKKYFVKIQPHLKSMESFIQDNKYALGYLTWADFYISEISHYIEKLYPQAYAQYKYWERIRQSVQSEEKVQQYYQRQNAIKGPFIPPIAKIFF